MAKIKWTDQKTDPIDFEIVDSRTTWHPSDTDHGLWELADRAMPSDVGQTADRWSLGAVMREIWRAAFIAGWRAAHSAGVQAATGRKEDTADPHEPSPRCTTHD